MDIEKSLKRDLADWMRLVIRHEHPGETRIEGFDSDDERVLELYFREQEDPTQINAMSVGATASGNARLSGGISEKNYKISKQLQDLSRQISELKTKSAKSDSGLEVRLGILKDENDDILPSAVVRDLQEGQVWYIYPELQKG